MFSLRIICKLILFAYLPCTLVYADPVSYKRQDIKDPTPESCQMQVIGYEVEFCISVYNSLDGKTYTKGRTFSTTIGDTSGVITAFNWTGELSTPLNGTNHGGAARVKSLQYAPNAGNPSNCKPMQLTVYNDQKYISLVEYFTPGKGPSWCMSYYDNTTSMFAAYNGVTMLNPMDESKLIGEGDEKGHYLVPMCPWGYNCPDVNLDDIFKRRLQQQPELST